MKHNRKTEVWAPSETKENPFGVTQDPRGATSQGDTHPTQSKADSHPKGVSQVGVSQTTREEISTNISTPTGGKVSKEEKKRGGKKRKEEVRSAKKEGKIEESEEEASDAGSPWRLPLPRRNPNVSSGSEDGSDRRTSRSFCWSSPGGGAQDRDRRKRQRKHAAATKLGGREVRKRGLIQASVLTGMAKDAGIRDAQKQLEQEQMPQQAFMDRIKEMKFQSQRSLAWILGTYFWNKNVHTHSWVVKNMLQKFRESGFECHLTHEPDLIIGRCDCKVNASKVDWLGPSSWSATQVPFFDQVLVATDCGDRSHFIHADGEYTVYTNRTMNTALWVEDQRFSNVDIKVTDASSIFALRAQYTNAGDVIFADEVIRSLIRPTRVFQEVTFAVAVQNILASPLCPNYCPHLPDFLNEAVLACYSENARMYQQRIVYGDRRFTYDDMTLQTFSGVSLGSKAVSLAFVLETYEERVKPFFSKASDYVDAKIEEIATEWEKGGKDDSGKDDDGDDKSGKPDVSSGKEEEVEIEVLSNLISEPLQVELMPISSSSSQSSSENSVSIQDPGSFWHYMEGQAQQLYQVVNTTAQTAAPTATYWTAVVLKGTRKYITQKVSLIPHMPGFTLDMMDQYNDLFHEIVQRDLLHMYFTIIYNTNIVNRRGLTIPMQLLNEKPDLLQEGGFVAGPMFVSWQESHEITSSGERVNFDELGRSMEYNTSRIAILVRDDTPLSCPNHSAVHYGLYLRKARCYNQDYSLVAIKKRLGRTIFKGSRNHKLQFATFCINVHFKESEPLHEAEIVDEALYLTYLEKMPVMSRKKHHDYFLQRQKPDFHLEEPRHDAYFVKADEIIIDRKGRGIINPPPWLFYSLVVWTTSIKKVLKEKMFHTVFTRGNLEILFTYGADLDPRMKSIWFTRAYQKCFNSHHRLACVLVGGDDNLCMIGQEGSVFTWESDVSACDQSHNEDLVTVMLDLFSRMGVPPDALAIWRESYLRPLKVKNRFTVQFHKMQLHTGHPHTSLANTFLVGLMAIYFCAQAPQIPAAAYQTWIFEAAKKLGMEWKVQVNENVLDSTFHKGFWVPCDHKEYSYQWLPLPSSVWKAFKIRTDCYIGHREVLLRLAFNQYQRIISPNSHVVRTMCLRQFEWIMTKLDIWDFEASKAAGLVFDPIVFEGKGSGFEKYKERALMNKEGEKNEANGIFNQPIGFDEEPWWDMDHEREFLLRRYGEPTSDYMAFAATWSGEIGAYYGTDFESMIIRDYGTDADGYLERCGIELHSAEDHEVF